MDKELYQAPKPSRVMRLFWKAAGADRFILERSTYGDQIKYVCLGGIIVATGLMAAIAGGYAFYTIFEPKGNALDSFKTVNSIAGNYDNTDPKTALLSIVFGLIWGTIIFNIDRFIVTSTGKGDGTEAITRKELVGALPRIIMGLIIAMTISKPVEIRMFKTEIDVALHEKQMEQQQIYKAKTDSLFNSELVKKDKEIEKTESVLAAKRAMYQNLQAQYIDEARIVTVGPRALAIKAEMEGLQREISSLQENPDYKRVKKEKEAIEKDREAKLNQSEKVSSGLDGLLERIKLAHEKAGWVISLFVTLLFITIELTPIFFKLMLIKSPYDYMEENIKELIKADKGIEIKYNYYPDKDGVEKDLVINHEVVRILKEKVALLETQSELSSVAINRWKKEKLQDIENNPTDYLKEEKA